MAEKLVSLKKNGGKSEQILPDHFRMRVYSSSSSSRAGYMFFDADTIIPYYTQVKYELVTGSPTTVYFRGDNDASKRVDLTTSWQSIPSGITTTCEFALANAVNAAVEIIIHLQ